MKNKKYVILGGGGCFGIETSFYLLENADPAKVIGIGRSLLREEPFSLNINRKENYEYHSRHLGHELDLVLEILDREKPEIIINFAAQGESAASWYNSWRFYETNAVTLSKIVEELGKRDWLEQFIHIGTSELYGSVNRAVNENDILNPTSPYAISKAAFDQHLLSVSNVLDFPMNIIRPSNAYCPGQLLHRVIPKALVCGLTQRKLPLQGGGKAKKSYMHARDLAEAIYMISNSDVRGKIYNVGPSDPTSIRELMVITAKVMGVELEDLCENTSARMGEDSCYWLDSSAIIKDFGWKQKIGLEEGIGEMYEWAKKYIDTLKQYSMEFVMRD